MIQTHFGDPCIHCGVNHEDMQPGACQGDPEKAIPIAYATLGVRYDGVEHYRIRWSTGAITETHEHVSFHAPYFHFGRKDELTAPPRFDPRLREDPPK